ncbi:glycosyltransferase [Marinobacter sp. 1_MG-2023]|uniref:glycosyltransferase n=1 Tax=Marinobacter sp. 1_MG-2023 TaxID=3062627 RepID=UPI0026E1EC53|nr:glycosyltransferase [Marinobacter sp. 1_MG-2023]MDO6824579.1 glycosyltransferase [Marinobacter sp. 1_MG-2023]
MKIAIFRTDSSTQDPASYNSQEMGLAKGFKNLGHIVDIIMASSSDRYNEQVVEGSKGAIRVLELPFRLIPVLNEPVYLKVGRLLSREQYDYVQINEEGNFSSYLIARVCRKHGLNFGIYQGMYRVLSGRRWTLYEAFHHRFFRPMLRKHSVGAFCKTSEARRFLDSKGYENTHVVPVGLDFSKFDNGKNQDWRARLNIGASEQLILYVGRLEQRRNPLFIAELASSARGDQHFVIVGEGPSRVDVEVVQKERSLNNLHLIGLLSQQELPSLYEQADVLILPSDYEIYGMVVAESLFFGTPVLSTRTAGPVDIIEKEIQGCLMSNMDVENWLTTLTNYRAFFRDRDNVAERISYAKSRFDWTEIAREYLVLISDAQ